MSGDVKRLYDSNGVEIVAGCHIHLSPSCVKLILDRSRLRR